MITDRRAFGPGGEDRLVERVAEAAHAGVHLVQVRERDLEGRPLLRLVERCLQAVRSTRTRVVVNDRVDVALAAGAHGVHLRADSMPASRIRRIVPPGFLVGRSIHSAADAIAATREGGLDYLVFGTVFGTASKPGLAPAGVDALAAAVAATMLPVLAVGGITAATAPLAIRAGAAGIAGIGLFAGGDDPPLADRLAAIRRAFDTSGTVL
jgi:thiamine-phosphate pyrophosphorylase